MTEPSNSNRSSTGLSSPYRFRSLVVGSLAALLISSHIHANVFFVTNLFDSGTGSLRDAITEAEQSSGFDQISFQVGGTLNFGSALPTITSDITISSNGFGVTFDGTSAGDRAFVQTSGTFSLLDFTIQNFTASGSGGAIFVGGGDLNIYNSSFIGNSGLTGGAVRLGGGGTGTIDNSIFSGNNSLQGGALNTTGGSNLNINSSQFTNNTATISGNPAGGIGGALSLSGGVVNITDSNISNNTGERSGAGIRINGATVNISNSTINENEAQTTDEDGGGLIIFGGAEVTITDSEINQNTSQGNAGGIQSQDGSIVIVERSTVSGNEAASDGGGIRSDDSELTVRQSTVSGNVASEGSGGGIIAVRDGNVLVENSTISGNTTDEGGGGILIAEGVSAVITNSTIAFNETGSRDGSGVRFGDDGTNTLEIENSIVSDNTQNGAPDSVNGPVTSNGFNLFDDDGGGIVASASGDQFNAFAGLEPLAENGGPTPTHALSSLSDAIDAGSTPQPTDQRGFLRPAGTQADIGAFEFGAVPEPSSSTFIFGILSIFYTARRRRR